MKEEKIGGLFKGVTSPMVSPPKPSYVCVKLISTLSRLGWYSICKSPFIILERSSH